MRPSPCSVTIASLALAGLALCTLSARAAPQPARADAERMMTLRGRISDVLPSSHELAVKPKKGEEVRLNVDDHSSIMLDHHKVSLDQLKLGDRVRVVYESAGGKNRVILLTHPAVAAALKRGVQDALTTAKGLGFRQKNEYRAKLESALRQLDDEIDLLEEQAENATGDRKRQLDDELAELRKKREEARRQLARVDSASDAAWQDIKSGVDAAVADLQNALERARSRFK